MRVLLIEIFYKIISKTSFFKAVSVTLRINLIYSYLFLSENMTKNPLF